VLSRIDQHLKELRRTTHVAQREIGIATQKLLEAQNKAEKRMEEATSGA
jgi:hypothetical protein